MTQSPQDQPPGPSDGAPAGWPQSGGTQPPAGGQPGSTLVVNIDKFGRDTASKANLYIDGIRMVNQEGANAYGVHPGRHMVSAEVNTMGRTYGQADLQVDVPQGATVQLFYTGPAGVGRPGQLGFQPAAHAGSGVVRATRGCLIAMLVALVLIVVLVVVALFFSGSRTTGVKSGPRAITSASQTDLRR